MNYLYGVAYYDEYMPYDRLDEDMVLLKKAGMNVIRIAESTWSNWEPSDNVFDFTHLHRMLSAAEKHGISVIIGTPTYAIPSWLAKKHPDILTTTAEGHALYGHRQLNDITNPHYRFHCERIIRRLMEELSGYSCIIGYQLDNETRSAGAASMETQKKYIEELKQAYPDIHRFNDEFGLNYWSNRIDSWEDFPDIRGTINGSLSASYKRFLRKQITEFLCWQADIIREYKKPEQFITHNFDFSWIGHSYGLQPEVCQIDAVKCMTVPGVDIYHPSQELLTGAEIAFGGAIARSLSPDKNTYLVLETQSQGNLAWLPYPGQLKLQALSHFASGARSVLYWNWHSIHNSFESYWKGILSHNLKENETYREICETGELLKGLMDRCVITEKTCRVAILIDNHSLTGLDEFPISDDLHYNDILRWFYDAFYELNVECNLVYKEDDFPGYDLLAVPALYSASREIIEKLRSYTEQGGNLLLGFKSCFSDDELKIYTEDQPCGLTECIGATYDQFTRPNQVTIELDGVSYPVREWMEMVHVTDATVWSRYQHPYWQRYQGVTHKKYGKGTATYLACYSSKDFMKALLRKLCAEIGLTLPDLEFPLIRKAGTNQYQQTVTYYFNYSMEEIPFFCAESGDIATLAPWQCQIYVNRYRIY